MADITLRRLHSEKPTRRRWPIGFSYSLAGLTSIGMWTALIVAVRTIL